MMVSGGHDDQAKRRYEAALPDVIADAIDEELLIVNLDTGVYFRAGPAVAAIWQALNRGHTPAELSGRPQAEIAAIIQELVANGLLRESAAAGAPRGSVLIPPGELALERHDDLADMLALDPVHDVDPDAGWPQRA